VAYPFSLRHLYIRIKLGKSLLHPNFERGPILDNIIYELSPYPLLTLLLIDIPYFAVIGTYYFTTVGGVVLPFIELMRFFDR
tara:strand:+ start:237 stop:482 length:246 start_codon:yes stop_codon:yes gene_type:complete